MWILYAILSAVFASLMSIFMKIGLNGKINANLATTLRTTAVTVLCWLLVLINGSVRQIKDINSKTWLYLILAAFATFGTWIFYFLALQKGQVSKVLAIDRFSIILTVILSAIFLKEVITIKVVIGIAVLILGTIMIVF